MHVVRRMGRRLRFAALAAFLSVLAATVLVWAFPPGPGAVSGVSEVRRLELSHVPASSVLKARVTLATGIAVTYETQDERDADRLFAMAQVFALQSARLTVYVEQDQIKEFRLSVR